MDKFTLFFVLLLDTAPSRRKGLPPLGKFAAHSTPHSAHTRIKTKGDAA